MPFSLQFLGVGGAFCMPTIPGDLTTSPMQSNMVITASSGKCMLFDCGTDIRLATQMCDFSENSFDAIYISHEHADHIGGLEWLLLNRLHNPNAEPPLLFAEHELFWRIWKTLRGGLMITTKGQMRFGDYVEQHSIHLEGSVLNNPEGPGTAVWEDLRMNLVPQVHVKHRTKPMMSYGMVLRGDEDAIYISSDTTFDAERIIRVAERVGTIFHDCEVGFMTNTHPHYDQLMTLPGEVRAKMWLYHYNPTEAAKKDVVVDGFRGFVQRGQTFRFD